VSRGNALDKLFWTVLLRQHAYASTSDIGDEPHRAIVEASCDADPKPGTSKGGLHPLREEVEQDDAVRESDVTY
jgi:hypothetical protein